MEFRKDYILDRWIVISERRGARPKQFKEEESAKDDKVCFFCPGSEGMTPEEIGRIDDKKGSWKMRWFPNKFPFASTESPAAVITEGKFFTHGGSYGHHEVIVETPSHELQMWDLKKNELEMLLNVYKERTGELSKKKDIKYVVVFKNHGAKGGTSLVHSHTQVVGYAHVPPLVKQEVEAAKKFDKCPYCRIADIESKSARHCFENSTAVAFAPYASRFNYEMWIMPKKHFKSLADLGEHDITNIAELLQKTLSKLKEMNVSYNIVLHYSPDGEDLHLHFEVLPRIATWAGFEFSTNILINSVSPETAAKFYRGEAEVEK